MGDIRTANLGDWIDIQRGDRANITGVITALNSEVIDVSTLGAPPTYLPGRTTVTIGPWDCPVTIHPTDTITIRKPPPK